ncbi:undecaprenyl-diphosphate phosphatase [Desulfobulbus oligotrophicus]|jgi:undecaprenyl-diphosphatase|uniref:Undecaprenyl-diphosphatase n=1 Tax=Desulfobulbus oligotrophicus TaxID=1909699 RepID=A0A7T5VCD3_9BACT|nr:undecaprenyl-diphosphate phosphatase [Desulfobulbus oligotrophicus]MDY0391206.1 undecaprenyl-diphosphate phosphatase [Desulfobulbus oligotrophicus]QQG65275.1 undecaprenyl-diphosphate phosphatase [Desulfobulbus oligotrophicus]
MDLSALLPSIVLGIVEGLTEFLPISSTGHLIIAGDLLNYTGDQAKTFEVCIQLGAILAVCWLYRRRLLKVITGLTTDRTAQNFVINLIVGILPSAVFGLLLYEVIKSHLFNPVVVALAMVVGGGIIFLVERRDRHPRITDVDQMQWTDALKVGLAQVFSMVPGTSRSGATIIGGLLFGLSRRTATEFSFFLAIPTMFLATGYDIYKSWHILAHTDLVFFGVGFITAFFSALVAIKMLIRYVANHDFKIFAWYRVVVGSLFLLYFMR